MVEKLSMMPATLRDTPCRDIRYLFSPSSLRNTVVYRPYNIVCTMMVSRKTIEAFKVLRDQNLSGLAVVDSAGRMVDVLSTRDLRGISPDSQTFRSSAVYCLELMLPHADFFGTQSTFTRTKQGTLIPKHPLGPSP